MKQLKFRAWSKEMKQFTYFNLPDISCAGIGACDSKDDLQQFTGLKDKKGKEIWEGDIVKWFKEFDFVISGCKDIETANFKVVFEDGAFWLDEINSDDPDRRNNRLVRNSCEYLWEKYETPLCEIIGNIYKNPELLKGIK